MCVYIFYARRATPHQPIHQPVNGGYSKTEAQELTRRAGTKSIDNNVDDRSEAQEAPTRLPARAQEAPRRLPGGFQAPRQEEFKTDPFQSPKNLISVPRFFCDFMPKWAPKWGPFFSEIRYRAVWKRLETASDRQNLKKTWFRKGTRFGASFGTKFNWIFRKKRRTYRRAQSHLALL